MFRYFETYIMAWLYEWRSRKARGLHWLLERLELTRQMRDTQKRSKWSRSAWHNVAVPSLAPFVLEGDPAGVFQGGDNMIYAGHHPSQPGWTIDDGRYDWHQGIFSSSLCMASSVPLSHDDQWRICHSVWSWEGNDFSLRRCVWHCVVGTLAARHRCWRYATVQRIQYWWRNNFSGCWGWCGGSISKTVRGVVGSDDKWSMTLSHIGRL